MAKDIPLGIEGGGEKHTLPVATIVTIIGIIILICVVAWYFAPSFYKPELKQEGEAMPILPKAEFNERYSDSVEDADNDGYYNNLSVNVGLKVEVGGGFSVNATLCDSVGNQATTAYSWANLEPGNRTITLKFDGIDIYLQEVNGSFSLRNLTLYERANWTKLDFRAWAYNTTTYNYTDFQNRYYAEWRGRISRSSRSPEIDPGNTTQEHSFEIKRGAKLITITLKLLTSGKDLDLYLYYRDEEVASSTARGQGKEGEIVETIELTPEGMDDRYGFWRALIHNYSNIYNPSNSADYCIIINVNYR